MFVLKSTLLKERIQAAQIAASQETLIRTLRERLEEADSRYRAVNEDLRLAVGLKPRVVHVPVEGAIAAPPPPKPEGPEWTRKVTTPESFKKAAEMELNKRWAEEQLKERSEAIARMS